MYILKVVYANRYINTFVNSDGGYLPGCEYENGIYRRNTKVLKVRYIAFYTKLTI